MSDVVKRAGSVLIQEHVCLWLRDVAETLIGAITGQIRLHRQGRKNERVITHYTFYQYSLPTNLITKGFNQVVTVMKDTHVRRHGDRAKS
jgi:hypothetical protein